MVDVELAHIVGGSDNGSIGQANLNWLLGVTVFDMWVVGSNVMAGCSAVGNGRDGVWWGQTICVGCVTI